MRNETVAELRTRAQTMSADIADMTSTLLRMADRDGWDAPEVVALDEDITRWEQRYHHLLARIKRARRVA